MITFQRNKKIMQVLVDFVVRATFQQFASRRIVNFSSTRPLLVNFRLHGYFSDLNFQ